MRRAIKVNFSPFTAEWNITGKNNVGYRDVNANTTYGTSRMNAYHILEDTLNLRDVRVYDTVEDADGKERRVLNQKETLFLPVMFHSAVKGEKLTLIARRIYHHRWYRR